MSDDQQFNETDTQSSETPGEEKRDPLSEFLRHQQRAVEETGKALESLLPPDFRDHGKQAGREFISGMKVLFDAAVDGLDKASQEFDKNFNRPRSASDSDDRPSSTGTTKVKVQVD
ncbi:MAG: hypothetical protein ABI835_15565 [Chloroflexota bacterium]